MLRVRYKPRVVEAEEVEDGRWAVYDPWGYKYYDDKEFRECFENEYDNVPLTPKDLTEQLSQELQRWGMTPLPLDAPVEVTLGLALAAVRQITFDIEQIAEIALTRDVAQELEELVK